MAGQLESAFSLVKLYKNSILLGPSEQRKQKGCLFSKIGLSFEMCPKIWGIQLRNESCVQVDRQLETKKLLKSCTHLPIHWSFLFCFFPPCWRKSLIYPGLAWTILYNPRMALNFWSCFISTVLGLQMCSTTASWHGARRKTQDVVHAGLEVH